MDEVDAELEGAKEMFAEASGTCSERGPLAGLGVCGGESAELALLFLPFFNAGITSSDARKCHESKQEAEKTKQAWNEDRKIDRTILVKAC